MTSRIPGVHNFIANLRPNTRSSYTAHCHSDKAAGPNRYHAPIQVLMSQKMYNRSMHKVTVTRHRWNKLVSFTH